MSLLNVFHRCQVGVLSSPWQLQQAPMTFYCSKESNGAMQLPVRYVGSAFTGLPGKQNMWMSLCGSWDSATGLSQVWINGKQSARKLGYTAGSVVNGKPIIILGQEQDAYGGKKRKKKGKHYFPKVTSSNEFNDIILRQVPSLSNWVQEQRGWQHD